MVTKKWAGLGKELFTSADNYIIALNEAASERRRVAAAGRGAGDRHGVQREVTKAVADGEHWARIRFWQNGSRGLPPLRPPMQEATLDGHLGRRWPSTSAIACQSFWFDAYESASLTPGSTLALFRVIGETIAKPQRDERRLAKCPRCKARLRRTHDMQRATRFEYLRCPNGHGRLISFFDFLREKDFIRPLTPQQIAELRRERPVGELRELRRARRPDTGAACAHCGSPLSMLDMKQAEEAGRAAPAGRRSRPSADRSDAAARAARARRETERPSPACAATTWFKDVSSTDLVGAGLSSSRGGSNSKGRERCGARCGHHA